MADQIIYDFGNRTISIGALPHFVNICVPQICYNQCTYE